MKHKSYESSHATKLAICSSLKELMVQKPLDKITVSEIMDHCGMVRQHFYYHFEDIPSLFRWMLERDIGRTILEAKAIGDGEARLRCLFVMAINAMPYMKKGMESNYRAELEQLLTQYVQYLFEQMCDEEDLYQNCTRFEAKLILSYHSHAVMGILRNWTDADTKHLDQIVHTVFRLMTEGISPTG